MIIVYSFVVADILHRGHIIHLEKAQQLGDFLIVGVLDGNTVKSYKRKPIMSMEDRMKIVSKIKGVDLVLPQFEKLPLNNLKLLHKLFKNDKIICVHGDDWRTNKFKDVISYLKTIGGELKLLPYYNGNSTTKVIDRIREKGT